MGLSHKNGTDFGIAVWYISYFHIKLGHPRNKFKKFPAPSSMQHYNFADRRRHLMHINWPFFMRLTHMYICNI